MDRADLNYWSAKDVTRLLSLMEAERRYFQEMVSVLPIGMAILGRDLTFASTNRAFRDLTGVHHQTVPGSTLAQAGLPAVVHAQAGQVLADGKPTSEFHSQITTAKGLRDVNITIQPFRDWDELAENELLLIVADVTTATGVCRSENSAEIQRLQSRIERIPAVVWELDPATFHFRRVVNAARLGLPLAHWIEGADFWSARVHRADLPVLREVYVSAVAGGLWSGLYRSMSADGAEIWLQDTFSVEHDEAGSPVAIHGVTLDATQSKLREDASAQALKTAALARASEKIAHECRNLLQIVNIQGEDLLHSLTPDNPLRANIQEILNAADRLKHLTDEFGSFVEGKEAQLATIDIDPFLAALVEEIRSGVSANIEFQMRGNAQGLAATTDPELLRLVIEELMARGIGAMPAGGSLSVTSSRFEVRSARNAGETALPPGDYVQIEIRDTGYAVNPATRERLWEPGGNLARLGQRVRASNGWLFLRSEFQQGSSFRILLPRAKGSSGEIAPQLPPPPRKTVLVVDDEASIRSLMRRILEREGFDAIEADNGRTGLEALSKNPGEVQLLVTDIVMPETTGFELAAKARELRPDIKVLFMSGYSGVAGFDPANLPAGSAFLQKPFSLQTFMAKVRELLLAANAVGA